MAVTYERVCQVISRPPDRRKDFEVNNLLPWFRKKSDLFRNLKTRLLFDLIKNLEFSSRAQDNIIIKQGEQGDCMYILLRGQVTIYINYALKAESDEGGVSNPPVIDVSNVPPEELRQHLGTFVTHLGPGATFGEVALMSEDCIRTASIIVDEPSDLIVIDRDLYTRSVKDVLKAEFEEKSNFIANNKYFRNWAPRYKKQLTMAMQKETFPYEGLITRQGNPVEAIYYILRGEVKLTMDAQLHQSQYKKLYRSEGGIRWGGVGNMEELESVKSSNLSQSGVQSLHGAGGEEDESWNLNPGRDIYTRRARKRINKQRLPPVDVCFLGINEPIGDVEVLVGLNTYMQTAQCTQRTEVLVLELKHYDRLLAKRNRRTVEAMKCDLEERLRWRTQPHHCTSLVPLLPCLLARAVAHNEEERARARARQNDHQHGATAADSKAQETVIPERGLLVDINGPGTVFYKIRQDYEKHHPHSPVGPSGSPGRKRLRPLYLGGRPARNGVPPSLVSGASRSQADADWMDTDLDESGSNLVTAAQQRQMRRRKEFELEGVEEEIDPETSEVALNALEEKLREWLRTERAGGGKENSERMGLAATHVPAGWLAPRVTKLHRVENCEPEHLKHGNKILLRNRKNRAMAPPVLIRNDIETSEKDRHRTLSELGYYHMALTAALPHIRPAEKENQKTGQVDVTEYSRQIEA